MWNAECGVDLTSHRAQAGPKDNGDSRLQTGESISYSFRGLPENRSGFTQFRTPHPALHTQTSIPAIDALMNAARLPAIIARKPRVDRSARRWGASPPMPPIWIAMEEKLANPNRQ